MFCIVDIFINRATDPVKICFIEMLKLDCVHTVYQHTKHSDVKKTQLESYLAFSFLDVSMNTGQLATLTE